MINIFRGLLAHTTTPLNAIIYLLSTVAVVFVMFPIHEFAHAFTASKLGDPTPKYTGRMTLNPLAHIDWIGAACVVLFGFGWAKPVKVNVRYFKNPKRDMAITALAGPVSNLIMAFVFLLVMNILALIPIAFIGYIISFLDIFVQISIYLAVLNLIPIPPFDGSKLLPILLPHKQYYALMRYERYFVWGVIVLLWIGVLSIPVNFLTNQIYTGINFIASLPFTFF